MLRDANNLRNSLLEVVMLEIWKRRKQKERHS